jgi:nucleotidyltransferase substrate binding protein (TIGR01987 family)
MSSNKPRWQYRFENFARAHALLREAIDLANQRPLADLERAGVIQRFEFTWELAWKLLNDLLSADGVQLDTVTPRSVLRSAYQARLISDGENWMRALDARNRMAHTYDSAAVERVVDEIARTYLALFDDLHARVRERSNEPQSPR